MIQAQIIDLFDEALEAPLSMSFEAPGVGEDVSRMLVVDGFINTNFDYIVISNDPYNSVYIFAFIDIE